MNLAGTDIAHAKWLGQAAAERPLPSLSHSSVSIRTNQNPQNSVPSKLNSKYVQPYYVMGVLSQGVGWRMKTVSIGYVQYNEGKMMRI